MYTLDNVYLVLGDNYLYCMTVVNYSQLNIVHIIGKMTNGDYLCIGFNANDINNKACLGKNTTDNVDIYFSLWHSPFLSSAIQFDKPNIIITHSDGTMEENADGTMATIQDLNI